jgi:catechol 2,3-dioxygenase-like lactoylglutathione lyase family enzyme
VATNNTGSSTPDQTASTGSSSGSPDPAALRLGHIHGVVVQVRDLERALAFYRDVLGFRVDENDGALAMLRVAGEGVPTLALSEIGSRATHYLGGTGVARVGWEVQSSADLDVAGQRLQQHGVRYERSHGEPVDYIYTSDPDGLPVVLLAVDTLGDSPPLARLMART